MPWLRTETDLASEEMFLPAALSGEWAAALDCCEGYLEAWQRAGRPVAPGRVVAPLAVALIHRLRGDEREPARWREAASMLRGPGPPTAYEAVFAAVGVLHDGDPAGAVESLSPLQAGFYGRLFRAWSIAVRFEAEVLLGAPTAEPAPDPNPVATLIVARASALRSADAAVRHQRYWPFRLGIGALAAHRLAPLRNANLLPFVCLSRQPRTSVLSGAGCAWTAPAARGRLRHAAAERW